MTTEKPRVQAAATSERLPSQAVRNLVTSWVLELLGEVPPGQLPPALRPITGFAAGKREAALRASLWTLLPRDADLRSALTELVKSRQDQSVAETPLTLAAWELLREGTLGPLWAQVLAPEPESNRQDRGPQEEPRSETPEPEVAVLRRENRVLRDRLGEARKDLAASKAAQERLQRADRSAITQPGSNSQPDAGGEAARVAKAQAARADALAAELSEVKAELARLRDQQRAVRRHDREAADARVTLLLDALSETATGLRRELGLSAQPDSPAELFAQALTPAIEIVPASGDGVATLRRFLERPRSHVVVDGYNVAKARWPQATLEEQRRLLSGRVSRVLGARTAEVTVVFDATSANSAERAAQRGDRSLRVLFSAAGELADDLIVDLIDHEPFGRAIAVITSDQELSRRVRQRGATPVPSAIFMAFLDGVAGPGSS